LIEVGGALCKTKLNAELYQTDQMKEAISHLYAHIILFFQQAVRWYNMSRVGRTFSAIVNPPELEYQDTVQQIKFWSESVDSMARAAGRAELRDIHVTVQLQHRKLVEMQHHMKKLEKVFDEKVTRVLEVGTSKIIHLFFILNHEPCWGH
jgi:hypothetical protein